jgi:hypothetical protein
MTEYVVRFLAGGVMVSAFAMLGDILRPKSFAGCSDRRPPSRSRRSASPCTGTEPATRRSKPGR